MIWGIIAAMAAVTFLLRFAFIALEGRLVLPDLARRALRYVPAAVLPALIVPAVLLPAGQLDLSLANPRIVAAALGAAVAWRTRSIFATLAVAMAALLLLQALGPG